MEYICWKDLPHNKKKKSNTEGDKETNKEEDKNCPARTNTARNYKGKQISVSEASRKSPRKSFHTSSFHSALSCCIHKEILRGSALSIIWGKSLANLLEEG
ncbi:hypothetical protein CEXT_741131 [Caerostris extrusa]|uniref:Uncharacterized protein n=1 Tax=Caerostris extrusa TaxID=172846 RepID=A0AAV4SRJ9_CAEEX|nr:hypothetical protein CEXT_741131 [Caerostris extrusa]